MALAGVLSVVAVLSTYSAVASANDATTREVESHTQVDLQAPQDLFEDVKFCTGCECACEAFYSSCGKPASTTPGQCCRDCCCNAQIIIGKEKRDPPVKGFSDKMHNWVESMDWNHVLNSFLLPLIVVVLVGGGMYLFLNAVFPTPASGLVEEEAPIAPQRSFFTRMCG